MAKLCQKLKWLVFFWDTVYNYKVGQKNIFFLKSAVGLYDIPPLCWWIIKA